MTDRDFVLAPATVRVTVSVEATYNILTSLSLLAMPESRSGLGEWITRTAASLPDDFNRRHRLVFNALFAAFEPDHNYQDFSAFIDDLAGQDAAALRDRALDRLHHPDLAHLNPPPTAELIANREAYLGLMERLYAEKDAPFERSLYEDAHTLLQDPAATQALVVGHLRAVWEQVMRPEWERVLPMLNESAAAFQQLDYTGLTALEAIRVVTGRDLSGIRDNWGSHLIFIPSAHIGPYVSWYDLEGDPVTRIIFGARLPEGARAVSPALSRSELLVRLNALADDTRLMIIELLTRHTELCAPEIMRLLDLSQSAASRHLRQLVASGYLLERRRDVAKCYSLNPQRVDDTLRALKSFLQPR